MSEERMPPIGTLSDRVQLKRRVTTDEAEGGETVAFAPIAWTWARVRPLPARAAFALDARGQAVTHSVVMRFRTDLKPGDRISYRGTDLDVEGLGDLNGRRAYLGVQCSARAVTG